MIKLLVIAAFAASAGLSAAASIAASHIVPAEPYAFDTVDLRMTVDSCAFVASSVSVSASGSTIRVERSENVACSPPGPPRVVDIRLGALPIGAWRVEVYATGQPTGTLRETIDFVVRRRPMALFPPPPITDYSGAWWNPLESGWGLSIHHAASHVVFGALFIYGADGQPTWFTLQSGRWTSDTRWEGVLYRTTGPFFAGPGFDPRVVLIQPAGAASLEFYQAPGEEGYATFTYTVFGTTITKRITRLLR